MVHVKTDNQAVSRLIKKMYTARECDNDLLREIAMWQMMDGWQLEMQWIPREHNDAADALSKNDMPRFVDMMGGDMEEMKVSEWHLAPPMDGMRRTHERGSVFMDKPQRLDFDLDGTCPGPPDDSSR